MRIFIITVALLLTTNIGFTADKEPDQKPQATDQQKSSSQTATKETKKPTWPRPYKSTEEISVDSIVPFPTDI